MNILTTFGGIQLDGDDYGAVRALLTEVATLHPAEGDAVGAKARALLAKLPPPIKHDYARFVVRQSETPVEYAASQTCSVVDGTCKYTEEAE